MVLKNKDFIEELFSRGVVELIDPEGEFKKRLEENPEKIVIKLGADPNRPDLHLGHAVILRALRKFQDLGCKVVFLVGDFTAQIGDPSGKSKVRPEVSQEEIENNMKTYIDQVGKILSTEKEVFSWIRNSDWFLNISDLLVDAAITYTDSVTKASVTFPPNSFFAKTAVYDSTRMQKTHVGSPTIHDVTVRTFLATLRKITYNHLIQRDFFQDRLKKGEELYMHELMYPVLQGIDSSVLAHVYGACDLEVGGTDQTFNMLMGRDVMRGAGQSPQAVLSFTLLEGTDGKEKMSKSLDNYIGISDEPNDMYGKIMSIPDTLIGKYFKLCTYSPLSDIEEIENKLSSGDLHPKDTKMRLAREIVEIYHGPEKSKAAEENFLSVFSKGEVPADVKTVRVKKETSLKETLIQNNLVESGSEFSRLLVGGAISSVSSKKVFDDPKTTILADDVIRVGKNRFLKIEVE
jgi:tyrosyl-tRNA synthetase